MNPPNLSSSTLAKQNLYTPAFSNHFKALADADQAREFTYFLVRGDLAEALPRSLIMLNKPNSNAMGISAQLLLYLDHATAIMTFFMSEYNKEPTAGAAFMLGRMYLAGFSVDRDKLIAIEYLKNADNLDYIPATTALQNIYRYSFDGEEYHMLAGAYAERVIILRQEYS